MVLPIPTIGCQQHKKDIAALNINGRSYSWEDYARWGKQVFNQGYAEKPPAGPFDFDDQSRSLRISDYPDYTCSRCHNNLREDPVLTDQDPEARFSYIQSRKPADYRTSPLKMVQGVTMWGGVNRMRFYNGLFSYFDKICVPAETTLYRNPKDPEGRNYKPVDCSGSHFAPCSIGCRQIDTSSLKDANQTCGRYCGVGRFLEDWEMMALQTYLWEAGVRLEHVVDSLQNHLTNLEKQNTTRAKDIAILKWKLSVLRAWLQKLDAAPPAAACQALVDSYLLSSCETLRDNSPGPRNNATCWRDWKSPAKSPLATATANIPAMIRHIIAKGGGTRAEVSSRGGGITSFFAKPLYANEPTLKTRTAKQTATPAFIADDVPPSKKPPTEALRRGKALYELSCGRCHGDSPNGKPQVGGRGHGFLAGSRHIFFKMVEHGLAQADPIPPMPLDPAQSGLYMPEFTLQRLSYQQAEDIYQYLEYLNGRTQ
jgi:mono/diheme cytochrome c family protein